MSIRVHERNSTPPSDSKKSHLLRTTSNSPYQEMDKPRRRRRLKLCRWLCPVRLARYTQILDRLKSVDFQTDLRSLFATKAYVDSLTHFFVNERLLNESKILALCLRRALLCHL